MRKLTLRPNQRFFLNVAGRIEEYRFVQANEMVDGSVSITARRMWGERLIVPLLASRGYVEREFPQITSGRFSGAVPSNAHGQARRISVWCGIYFTRRRAKTGISTHQPWLERELEITANPMNERETIFARLAASIDRMALHELTGSMAERMLQPDAKSSDLLNAVVGTTSTVTGRTPTYNELSDLAYRLKRDGTYERPIDKKPSIFADYYGIQVRKFPGIIIKGGI